MADDCKIIKFPGSEPAPNQPSAASILSGYLEEARNNVGLYGLSSDVITSPLSESYQPFMQADGSMKLGREGIDDFRQLFGNIEHEGRMVNWVGMHVVYNAYYLSIKALVKKPETDVHNGLLRVANFVINTDRVYIDESKKPKDVHDIEDDITGWFSAIQAKRKILHPWEKISDKKKVVTLLNEAAATGLHPSNEFGTIDLSRKKTLGHFTLRLLSATKIENSIKDILQDNRGRQATIEE